jgi:PAS domain S-box-containing protein
MGADEVIRHMPVAAMVLEAPSGRILHANRRAREMVGSQLGRTIPSELAPDWEIFHPDGRPYRMEEWPLVRSMKSGEEVVNEEYFNVLADGSRLFVRCSSSPIYDGAEIVGGLLVMDDITEQKRAEEERAYHAILIDNVEDAVVGTDAQFRLTVWNRGAERLYGFAAQEVLGRDARDVASYPGDESRFHLERELLETDRTRTEITAHRKDGTRVEVELASVAVRDAQGEIIGYLGIHRDVTERKRAEDAVRAAQRRSETILESITDAFVAMDGEWRLTYLNERALAQMREAIGLDVTAEELLGKSIWDVAPQLVGTAIDQEFHRALREQTVVEFEAYYAPVDRWVEILVYPSEGGLSVYSHDISARKSAHEQMNRRAEQQARVAELGQRALAGDDLQSLLDEAVGLVARTLDVELVGVAEIAPRGDQVVLRAGVGWREDVVGRPIEREGPESLVRYTLRCRTPVIVEDLGTDPRLKPSGLARRHGAASALSVMIESPDEPFGTLAALSQRQRTFSPSDVSFLQAVANVLASAVERNRAEQRLGEVTEAERRRIARDLHDEALQELTDALVQADRGRRAGLEAGAAERLAWTLRRVGQQLRGAIYDLRLAEEENRPFPDLLTGLVELQRAMAADCEIELDLGEGTPANSLGKSGAEVVRIVGEALINARRHSNAEHIRVVASGSANRLSIEIADDGRGFHPAPMLTAAGSSGLRGMHERAALLDGDLEISSEPGAGTEIHLSVPLGRDRGPSDAAVRVLLVEDHTAVREAIAAQLEREPGFEVVGQAASLAEARTLIKAHVDIALVDLGLPDGNGSDLIKELRQINPRTEALVLSASLDRTRTADAIASGASATLDKTAHLDEVIDAVRRLRAGETLLDLDDVIDLRRFAESKRAQERDHRQALESLTPRERDVLQALAEGLNTQAVANRLHITTRTQRNHVANILAKLGVHSQLQAVLLALRYGTVKIH